MCRTQTNRLQTILTVMLCVRTQTILIVMLCVQNTDNSHRHVVCAEHRQLSLSCCVCRTQTNRTQTSLTVMLCVKNTDNSHRHVVCAEHRQFSPSCCVQNTDKQSTDNSHRQVVCRTQREHRQFSLSFCECRTQLGGGVDTSISGADDSVW